MAFRSLNVSPGVSQNDVKRLLSSNAHPSHLGPRSPDQFSGYDDICRLTKRAGLIRFPFVGPAVCL